MNELAIDRDRREERKPHWVGEDNRGTTRRHKNKWKLTLSGLGKTIVARTTALMGSKQVLVLGVTGFGLVKTCFS
jgi:hypothetical protein